MLDRSLQPPLDIEKYPRDIGVMSNRLQDQFPIEIVKEAFDIQIDHPVLTSAALTCDTHRIQRGLAGTIPIRVRMEMWFYKRFQHQLHDHLSDPIGDRRPF